MREFIQKHMKLILIILIIMGILTMINLARAQELPEQCNLETVFEYEAIIVLDFLPDIIQVEFSTMRLIDIHQVNNYPDVFRVTIISTCSSYELVLQELLSIRGLTKAIRLPMMKLKMMSYD